MRAFLTWLQSRLKTRQICHQGKPYLERSYVCTVPSIFGMTPKLRVYLHRFVASDEDGLHDHPFRWSYSFLLRGWYWEDRWGGRRKVRFFNLISPNAFHRVVLPDNGRDVWTLFVHTARRKPWGFLRPSGAAQHGTRFEYLPASVQGDPEFSDWSRDKTGAQLRASGALFHIPTGQNAYACGLAEPDAPSAAPELSTMTM